MMELENDDSSEVPEGAPSPEEIRQACEEIQQEWTPREREKRNGYKVPPVTFNPGCLAEH